MTGLEKILAEISGEAQASREAALQKAQAEAEALRRQTRQQTDAECEKLQAQGEKACRDILAKAQSGAELQRRRLLLETRQELLHETLSAAAEAIIHMPLENYEKALLKIASLYAHPGEGLAYFSQRDLDRLPADFEKQLNQALPEGRSLRIAPEARSMYGGMVLAYGGVEENCTLRALFDARRENLLDLADEILFGARA